MPRLEGRREPGDILYTIAAILKMIGSTSTVCDYVDIWECE